VVEELIIRKTVFMEPVPQPRPRIYPTARGMRASVPDRVTSAKDKIAYALWEEGEKFPPDAAIRADFKFYLKKPKKPKYVTELPIGDPDWDNLGKLVSDAINNVVYRDDAQITDARVRKRYGEPHRVEITLTIDDGQD